MGNVAMVLGPVWLRCSSCSGYLSSYIFRPCINYWLDARTGLDGILVATAQILCRRGQPCSILFFLILTESATNRNSISIIIKLFFKRAIVFTRYKYRIICLVRCLYSLHNCRLCIKNVNLVQVCFVKYDLEFNIFFIPQH